MDKEKVLNLAKLARIEISEDEAENLSHEFEAILKYVGEVKEVGSGNQESGIKNQDDFPIRNIMRDNSESHESGIYTEKLLNEAPSRDGQYVRVKKIL